MIGAGGHAKVCIELFRRMGETVEWCVGDEKGPDVCLGVGVVKGDEHIARLAAEGYRRCFVAIGSNRLRARLAETARASGFQLVNAIAPSAIISATARIDEGVAIMEGVVVNAAASVGALSILNTNSSVDHDCTIGVSCHLAPNSALAGNVVVGDRTFLGIGCSVIPEVRIGSDVTVGAGAVVIRDVPTGSTAVGVPARLVA